MPHASSSREPAAPERRTCSQPARSTRNSLLWNFAVSMRRMTTRCDLDESLFRSVAPVERRALAVSSSASTSTSSPSRISAAPRGHTPRLGSATTRSEDAEASAEETALAPAPVIKSARRSLYSSSAENVRRHVSPASTRSSRWDTRSVIACARRARRVRRVSRASRASRVVSRERMVKGQRERRARRDARGGGCARDSDSHSPGARFRDETRGGSDAHVRAARLPGRRVRRSWCATFPRRSGRTRAPRR